MVAFPTVNRTVKVRVFPEPPKMKYCRKCEKQVEVWNYECPMGLATVYECMKCGYLWRRRGEYVATLDAKNG